MCMPFEIHMEDKDGDKIIRLTEPETGTQAEIYSFGGLLNAFRIQGKNEKANLVDGFLSPKEARLRITDGFKSTKLSPFVCRLRHGKYTFEGNSYQVEHFFLAGHAIHGIIYDATFHVLHTRADEQGASVTLQYAYTGTDKGFPFPYMTEIRWTLEKNQCLTVNTRVTNTGSTNMPLADGWHPYFCLGGTIDDCTLRFTSETQLEYDADLLPTGNTIHDRRFINGCSLKGVELDNSYVLPVDQEPVSCVLENRQYRITVLPDKNYPILQLYIPPQRTSMAIENLSGPPDNFNNGILLVSLTPGETKSFTTQYLAEVL